MNTRNLLLLVPLLLAGCVSSDYVGKGKENASRKTHQVQTVVVRLLLPIAFLGLGIFRMPPAEVCNRSSSRAALISARPLLSRRTAAMPRMST